MEASKVQIGLLEGKSNWSTWKYELCILLRGVKGELEVLEGKLQAPKPLVENASQEEKSRYDKNLADFNQADSSALLILTVNMTRKTLEKVMRFSTTRDMWLELQDFLMEMSRTGRMISRDVIFDECKPLEIVNENKNEYLSPLPQDNVLDYVKSKDSSKNEEETEHDTAEYSDDIEDDTIEEDNIKLRRQLRHRRETRMPKHFENYVMTVAAEIIEPREPLSYKEAITCNERKDWILAMEKEIQSLQENYTWEMKNSPVGKKAIPCKWVYKLKTNSDESIDKLNFKKSDADPCLYIKKDGENMLLLALYVDDGLLASTSETMKDTFIHSLQREFKITVKPASYFLGLEIEKKEAGTSLQREFKITVKPASYFLGLEIEKKEAGTIQVNQSAYTKKILERFGIAERMNRTFLDTARCLLMQSGLPP
ncbi:hypothetical protein JTB14_018510 [Gonioctena quinquepunctata]|nr:hypothetical protein JTB14_018510 [Gonioctena quinquepunctata]